MFLYDFGRCHTARRPRPFTTAESCPSDMGRRHEHSRRGRCARVFFLTCDTAHCGRTSEEASFHDGDGDSHDRRRGQYERNAGKLAKHAIVNARLRSVEVAAVVNVVDALRTLGIEDRHTVVVSVQGGHHHHRHEHQQQQPCGNPSLASSSQHRGQMYKKVHISHAYPASFI